MGNLSSVDGIYSIVVLCEETLIVANNEHIIINNMEKKTDYSVN